MEENFEKKRTRLQERHPFPWAIHREPFVGQFIVDANKNAIPDSDVLVLAGLFQELHEKTRKAE